MKWVLLTILNLSLWISAQAKPLSVVVEPGDRLWVKSFSGKLTLKKSASTQMSIRFKGQKSLFTEAVKVSKERGVIRVQGSMDRDEATVSEIEIVGPSLPTHIFWGEGQLEVQSWSAKLHISQEAGTLRLKSNQSARLVLNRVKAEIAAHKGDLQIDSYRGDIQIDNHQGKLALENFVGDLSLNKITGDMDVTLYKGKLRAKSTRGHIELTGQRAHVDLAAHRGALKAQLEQGSLRAQVLGSPQVTIKTREAGVNLKTAKTGARVDLGTTKAYLSLPSSLRRARLSNMVVARGHLLGTGGGRIYVRTESGNIKLH